MAIVEHYKTIRVGDWELGEIWRDSKCNGCGTTAARVFGFDIWVDYDTKVMIDLCPECLRQIAQITEEWRGPNND